MSTIIMSACWPMQGMSPAQKAVLVSLADQANDDGVCWPSVKHIAMRTCLSERSVQSAIKWLVSANALSIQERSGRSTVYVVTPATFAPPQEMRPAATARTPANNVTTPADAAPAPANAAPITINNRNRTTNEPQKAIDLPEWLPEDAWLDWVAHRKAVKAPLTKRAAELCINKLEKLRAAGSDPVAVIEQSVITGRWTDLYPLKSDVERTTARSQKFDPSAYVNRNRTPRNDSRTVDVHAQYVD